MQFLPKVIAAYRSARDYAAQTRVPTDSNAATTWHWPTQAAAAERPGRAQVAAQAAVPVHVEVTGVGPVGPGGSLPLPPGSYQIVATAAGHEGARVTREVVPGVTTVLEFHLRSALAQVTPRPQPAAAAPAGAQQPVAQRQGGKFPVVWVVAGTVGAGCWWPCSLARAAARPRLPPPTRGGIIILLPQSVRGS